MQIENIWLHSKKQGLQMLNKGANLCLVGQFEQECVSVNLNNNV